MNLLLMVLFLLHYTPLILCISLIVRSISNYLQTEKIKNNLAQAAAFEPDKIQPYRFILSNWLFIISILMIISGFLLDVIERKNIPITDNILT